MVLTGAISFSAEPLMNVFNFIAFVFALPAATTAQGKITAVSDTVPAFFRKCWAGGQRE